MTELEKRLNERKIDLENAFRKRYPVEDVNGNLFFVAPDNSVFTLTVFPHFESILIEHAPNIEKANGGLDDGDMYDVSLSLNEMIEAMTEEIES